MQSYWPLLLIVGTLTAGALVFYLIKSRRNPKPFSATYARQLTNPWIHWLSGTQTTLERMGLQPGQRVLEIGPGPGRIAISVATIVGPEGEVVGLDVQQGMLELLEQNAARAGVTNLRTIKGDAAAEVTPSDYFDAVIICTALGEFPDKPGAISQAFRSLKSGGLLHVTELVLDPHYQRRGRLIPLAERAGFRLRAIQGSPFFYTASFEKPRP